MARIDWTLLCEDAYFDRQDRLCVVGIIRTLPVQALPTTLPQVVLVARLADITLVDEIAISVGVVTPSGLRAARMGSEGVTIQVVREYALATLREIRLVEEGLHRFQIRLRGQSVVVLDIPVLASRRSVVH